jgi:hypothetical protein
LIWIKINNPSHIHKGFPAEEGIVVSKIEKILIVVTVCAVASSWWGASSRAAELQVPQSLVIEHRAVIDELTRLAGQGSSVAVVATKALPLIKAHFLKESTFVFPPLSLLKALTDGQITPEEARIAISMSGLTKASQADLMNEHVQITSLMLEMQAAAKNDPAIQNFATRVAAHSLDEIEVLFPATIVLGDYLRIKFGVQK